MDNEKTKLHVVFYRTGGIGDVILSIVSLQYVLKSNVNATIYWISFQPLLNFIASSFPNVIPVEISRTSTYKENTKRINEIVPHADVVIDLQRSMRSILLCKKLAVKHKTGYFTWNKGSIRRTLLVLRSRLSPRNQFNSRVLNNPYPRFQSMYDCTRRALQKFSIDALNVFPELAVPNTSSYFTSESPQSKPILGICSGGLHSIKWAPKKLFCEIINTINTNLSRPLSVAFFGDEFDFKYSAEIIDGLNHEIDTNNYCGKFDLAQTAMELNKCDFFLSNDTALAHMAEALGMGVAMLFGPTVEAFGYAPFRKDSQAFSSKLGCRPCSKSGNTTCRFGDKRCFQKINPTQVSSFILNRVNEK